MLTTLKIQNLAIIPEAQISFKPGFNVLTGETGAGKSILIDAISLLAGGRASVEDVRAGAVSASIEAVLQVPSTSSIWVKLDELGIPKNGDELILRRIVGSDGRSRAFVNDQNLTVSALSTLAPYWADLSGQHGQLQFLAEENHLEFVDRFGGLFEPVGQYQAFYERYRELTQRLNELKSLRSQSLQEQEFLKFQLSELEKVNPSADEYDELESRHRRLSHAAQLAQLSAEMESTLDGEAGLQEKLGELTSHIRSAEKFDPSVTRWQEKADSATDLFQELSLEVSKFRHSLDFEPEEIDSINSRLADLQTLRRKYGSIERAIEEKNRIQKLLVSIEDSGEEELRIIKDLEEIKPRLGKAAQTLTDLRRTAAQKLAGLVSSELKPLGMGTAQIRIEFVPVSEPDGIGPTGAETARIQFAPNPGEGFKLLSKIASGGELSRVLLAIKSVSIRGCDSNGVTYLFDEADSGIGGETAERVGLKMKELAQNSQVLCVTHLAQIACYGDTHLHIEKQVKGGRTFAQVHVLSESQKTEELARMIGGLKVSKTALDHAGELLARGRKTEGRALTL